MEADNRPEPTVIVIFGAGGDLTRRKLVPALYNLFLDQTLPGEFALVGVDRRDASDEGFRQELRQGVDQFSRRGRADAAAWETFAARIRYIRADFNDPSLYGGLMEELSKLDKSWHTRANHIFYLATSPALFCSIAACLG